MKNIIIFATKYGCAEKAANILKSKMKGDTTLINISKENVPNIDQYDNVMLGGSIYVGRVQKKLTEYVNKNLSVLLNKNVGLFICAAQPEPIKSQELESSFPIELYNHAKVKDVFGYEFDFGKLGFLDKLMVRKVSGISESKFELSEEKIQNFAIKMCN